MTTIELCELAGVSMYQIQLWMQTGPAGGRNGRQRRLRPALHYVHYVHYVLRPVPRENYCFMLLKLLSTLGRYFSLRRTPDETCRLDWIGSLDCTILNFRSFN